MKFLTDFFKESDSWSDSEINALFKVLMGMASIDGKKKNKNGLKLPK